MTTIRDSRDDRSGQRYIILASSSRGYAPQDPAGPSPQDDAYRLVLDDEIIDVTRVW